MDIQATPDNSEWLPLGVFAITQDGQASGVEPTLFMQLAVSKEGVIAGTLKNMATDQVQTLEGMADKKSQRAAWCVKGQKRRSRESYIGRRSNRRRRKSPSNRRQFRRRVEAVAGGGEDKWRVQTHGSD